MELYMYLCGLWMSVRRRVEENERQERLGKGNREDLGKYYLEKTMISPGPVLVLENRFNEMSYFLNYCKFLFYCLGIIIAIGIFLNF